MPIQNSIIQSSSLNRQLYRLHLNIAICDTLYVHTVHWQMFGKLAPIYRDNFEVSLLPKSYNRWSQKFRSECVECGDHVETWRRRRFAKISQSRRRPLLGTLVWTSVWSCRREAGLRRTVDCRPLHIHRTEDRLRLGRPARAPRLLASVTAPHPGKQLLPMPEFCKYIVFES